REVALASQIRPCMVFSAAEDHVAHDTERDVGAELARRETFFDNSKRALRVPLIELEYGGPAVLRPRAHLMDDEAAQCGIGVNHTEMLPDQKTQTVPGSSHSLELALIVSQGSLVETFYHLDEQLAFRGKIPVQRTLDHACLGSDL